MFRYFMPLVAALAMIPLPAQAASTHNNQTPGNLQQPSAQQPMSSNARLKVSNDVSSVLNDTNEAREAIAANNKAEALHDVNDAIYALRQARWIAPNERFVPLRNAVPSNQTSASGLAAQRTHGEYTSVVLDTQLASTHLTAVKLALEENKLSEADAGLKATQDDVTLTSADGDMPLLRARAGSRRPCPR